MLRSPEHGPLFGSTCTGGGACSRSSASHQDFVRDMGDMLEGVLRGFHQCALAGRKLVVEQHHVHVWSNVEIPPNPRDENLHYGFSRSLAVSGDKKG